VKSYPQADEWKDDDRVLCKNCSNLESRGQQWNFRAEDFEKFRRLNEKPAQWMFEAALVKNGWPRFRSVRTFVQKRICTASQKKYYTIATCSAMGLPQVQAIP
jgi:hypothetical protein